MYFNCQLSTVDCELVSTNTSSFDEMTPATRAKSAKRQLLVEKRVAEEAEEIDAADGHRRRLELGASVSVR